MHVYPRRNGGLTVAQQYLVLRRSPSCAGHGNVRCGRLVWEFNAQPTPLSRIYRVRIVYQQRQTPLVFVIVPDVRDLAGGRRIPHVYSQKPTRLCLYLPSTYEWSKEMTIADTIVPWAILWLFYFEEWLASDEWKGGGMHPKVSNDNRKKKNSFYRRGRH